jgi:hypothetical protein
MASGLESALRAAHRANIDRYRRLLKTDLTDIERQFVRRRLAEEQEALRQIAKTNALLDSRVD